MESPWGCWVRRWHKGQAELHRGCESQSLGIHQQWWRDGTAGRGPGLGGTKQRGTGVMGVNEREDRNR